MGSDCNALPNAYWRCSVAVGSVAVCAAVIKCLMKKQGDGIGETQ